MLVEQTIIKTTRHIAQVPLSSRAKCNKRVLPTNMTLVTELFAPDDCHLISARQELYLMFNLKNIASLIKIELSEFRKFVEI